MTRREIMREAIDCCLVIPTLFTSVPLIVLAASSSIPVASPTFSDS